MMNEWVEKSIKLANSKGYLDNLQKIYPVNYEQERIISSNEESELKQLFNSGDNKDLIKRLLKFKKFPINDPYVAFLRKNTKFIEYNPQTVDRIANRIRFLGFDNMIKGICEPKVASRKFGSNFKNWINNIGYRLLNEEEIASPNIGIAILNVSDVKLRLFANTQLGLNISKNPDFIIKVNDTYIVGEAKFLTDIGGAQNANFQDAINFLNNESGDVIKIAVLDGVVWIKSITKMYRTVCSLVKPAFSALLLNDYLKSIK